MRVTGLLRPALHVCAAVLALAACSAPVARGAARDPVRITFLDVGQGDAVVIQAPEGQTALVDAGPGVDVVPALEALGVTRLDLVVATHPHADHIGGMDDVLRSFPVRFYMDNGEPYTTSTYLSVMRELRSRREITYLEATPRTLELGSVSIEVLQMPATPDDNPNNRSVGLIVKRGAFRAFLSGDSEVDELLHFMELGEDLDVTLLKAPHHGSDDAVSDVFLSATTPDVVVISVGEDNRYGHPHAAALSDYTGSADELYRTDRDGQVTVAGFEDGSYEVTRTGRGQGSAARYDSGGDSMVRYGY
ncbi:MAG: MBL fold metallo-hydrolase [Gemmatimonadota bacterium]